MRNNEERYRSLMEQAPFSIQVFSPDGRTIRVNRAFEELWGVRFDEMRGYNILEDAQLERAGILDAIRRGFAGETTWLPAIRYDPDVTVPGISQGGDPRRWLSATIYPVRDDHGAICEVVIIHEDITARRLAEEERNASEQRLRMLLESISDAFFAVDAHWRFTYVNPQAGRVVSQMPPDLLGKVVQEEFPGLPGSDFDGVFRRVMTERVQENLCSYYPDHDRWYEVNVYPATDGGILVFVQNVSDRVRAEQELARATAVSQQQRRVFEAIGDTMDYGIWICDADGRNTYASDSFLRLVGMTQQECSESGWLRALHPDDAERTMAEWQDCVQRGAEWDKEHRFLGADGDWHPVLARGVPVRDDGGRIVAWAGINLDISRLKQVEVELREADRRKDEFLATLAHELRNPLAPIRNSLEILKLPRLEPAMACHAREMMERQLHHLVRLVDDLLDVSRVMRGKIELRRERVELANVIARAVETSQPLIDLQGHRLELDIGAETLLVDADPVRLAQVFGNLLTNAAKYGGAGGLIRLAARCEGETAVVNVEDDGIGMSPELIPHVFELFVQGEHPVARAQGGLGVGLTLVRRLVEMHGGSVEARSDGSGLGSRFTVRLPLAAHSEQKDSAIVDEPGPVRCSSGLRLLVVDDNRDAAVSLSMLLCLEGHEVRVAHDGPSGIRIASEWSPDLVFLDLGMPGMDGYEVARRLRRRSGLEGVVLAALTGWGQQEDRRRSADAGFDHHLVKPPEPERLRRLLSGLRKD